MVSVAGLVHAEKQLLIARLHDAGSVVGLNRQERQEPPIVQPSLRFSLSPAMNIVFRSDQL